MQCQHALLLLRSGRTGESLEAFGEAIRYLADPVRTGQGPHQPRWRLPPAGHRRTGRSRTSSSRRGMPEHAQSLPDEAMAHAQPRLRPHAGWRPGLGAGMHGRGSSDAERPLSPGQGGDCEQDRAEVLLGCRHDPRGPAVAAERLPGRSGCRRMHQRRGEAELALARTLLHTDPAQRSGRRAVGAATVHSHWGGWVAGAGGRRRPCSRGRPRAERVPALLARGDSLIAELESQGLEWGAASITAAHRAGAAAPRGPRRGDGAGRPRCG